MCGNLGIDHLALALAHRGRVDGDGTRHGAELWSMAHQIRDLPAPNLILTGQAVDVGTGAPDIPALHDGSPSRGSRHLSSQELATLAAAEDQDFQTVLVEPCASLPVPALSRSPSGGRPPAGRSEASEGATRCPSLRAPPVRSMPPQSRRCGPRHAPTLLMLHLEVVDALPTRRTAQSIS